MIELLSRAAGLSVLVGERSAVAVHDATTSYDRLLRDARAVAGGLVALGRPRFAVLDDDAATVLALLAGASAVGAEACTYPPLVNDGSPDDVVALRGLLARLDHDVLVTRRTDLDLPVRVVHPDELLAAEPVPPPGRTDLPVSRPHLVLTTGTTGAPRGVRHDWSRLVRGVRRVGPAHDERWLLAYGLHQFAGLQVVLHVAASGATLVAPAPRRPREGLAAMRALGVTHASATPTYWRFLLAEARADGRGLPELRQVTLGGEAVPASLLEQVRAAVPGARVSQVYAASEFGSTGSVRDGRAGLSVASLDRGDDADVDLRVVDGELWVRSRTGMLGYYGEPPLDADAWRRTGDLVEVVGDRVEFRGRASEVINVGGVKVHPLPVEERVASVPGVAVTRVWGRPNAVTGAIVAVDVVLEPGADEDAVRSGVKAACADLLPAARPRSVRIVEAVETRGDKIVRSTPA